MSDESEERREEEGETPEENAGSEKDDTDREGRRPIPVGDLMPSPSPRPDRRPAEREGPRQGAGKEEGEPAESTEEGGPAAEEALEEPPEGTDGAESGPEEPGSASVPTPVRVAMDAAPPGDSRPVEELPSTEFEAEGRSWVVRITGRTVTGTRPDAGALLMTLTFFDREDPDLPLRSLITVERPLEALYPEDLEELLRRSRPLPDARTSGSSPRS